MNTQQISYFLAICKYGTFTEASKRLYVAQPAVSKQILRLEEELGVKLFKREYGKCKLTEEGKIMQETFESVTELFANAQKKIFQLTTHPKSQFKIVILQGIDITEFIYNDIQQFIKDNPEIHLTIESLSHEQLNSVLRLNHIDLAITLQEEVINDGLLDIMPIYKLPYAVIMRSTHPLAQSETLDLSMLSKEIFIATRPGSKGFDKYTEDLIAKFKITKNQIKVVQDINSLISNVETGCGVAFLGIHLVHISRMPLTSWMWSCLFRYSS
jgi:DNA-binding transcriptional LysR family regulator